jgi:predicted metalloenzyme YecM
MKKFNVETLKKTIELEDFAKNLFVNEYESKWSNQSVDLADEFDEKVKDKAKELGLDLNLLEIDGESLYFEDEETYQKATKTIWIEYCGNNIFNYEWK